MKKTISFDLWNTLITANPTFKHARLNLCIEYSGKTDEECTKILKRVKEDFDYKLYSHRRKLI